MRRVLILLAALVVAVTAYFAATGLVLYRVAAELLRVGGLEAMIAGAQEPPQDPRDLGWRGDPQAAFGMDFVEVLLPGEIGPLPAWIVPPDSAGRMAAIYVHGIAGAREDGYRHLPLLREGGVPVLLLSYRGDPGAPLPDGGVHSFGIAEWADLEAAADWWVDQGAERLIIVAESMGGGITGQWLARTAHADRVAGIALDSPALSFRRVLAGLADARNLPFPDTIARTALLWQAALGPVDMRPAEVEDRLAAYPGPVFLAHGTGDRIVPAAISADLAAARDAPTITVTTTADHLQSWHEDPDGYAEAFARFLRFATVP
ncbi:MAG: hypothetical protein JJT81_17930 [Rubellimicrobium sp.]|nr:hypothetical protein [Rubellimicrobium sp.]